MTEAEVQAFCANNGISVSPVGQPLHVVDPTELPASVRKFVNDDGTYKGDGKPESEDAAAEGGVRETAAAADEASAEEGPRATSQQSTKKGATKASRKK